MRAGAASSSSSPKADGALRRFLPPHAYTHLSGGFVLEDERHPYPVEDAHRPRVRDVLLEGAWPDWLREQTQPDAASAPSHADAHDAAAATASPEGAPASRPH